jgi:dihydroxyacetone kinase
LGAAAEDGKSFNYIEKLGNSLKDQLVSIATTLDHCHVPGRKDHSQIDSNTLEIGTGPHNEPVRFPFAP